MDDHDRFLVLGAAFIVSLLIGMALGNLWSSLLSGTNMSAMLLG
jgi:hypothetical protein